MPWKTVSAAKKAGAIINYQKKPISLSAINKLYEIYDAIKADGKADDPMAVAMDSWKDLIELKNGRWVLKPKKKTEQAEVELAIPAGISKLGDGSVEAFKEMLANNLKDYFGKGYYVYIVSTYRDKVYVSVEDSKTYKIVYYEVPYKITKLGIELGTITKVEKVTKFQRAEQNNRDFRQKVRAFVTGGGSLAEAVNSAFKLRREIICRPG